MCMRHYLFLFLLLMLFATYLSNWSAFAWQKRNHNRIRIRYRHYHNRFRPYRITLSIRNNNVTDAEFFRLVGVDNTVDFYVGPGKIFTNSYETNRKGYWTLFVEFSGDRYAKSPRKIISRDSFNHWIIEVYYYPNSVGFSDWQKMR